MKKIKQIFRFLFNRSVVLSPEILRNKIICCRRFIYFDSIAMLICAAVVVFSSVPIVHLANLGFGIFTSWFLVDILDLIRLNNLYFKYFKGGVIFEDPNSFTSKDSEKEI